MPWHPIGGQGLVLSMPSCPAGGWACAEPVRQLVAAACALHWSLTGLLLYVERHVTLDTCQWH